MNIIKEYKNLLMPFNTKTGNSLLKKWHKCGDV